MGDPATGTEAPAGPAHVRLHLWAVILPGLALIGLGAGLGLPGAAPLGTILLGAALAVSGIAMIRSRRFTFYNSARHNTRRERYSGGAAVAWGIFSALSGAGVAVAGGLVLIGLDGVAGRLILQRPSLALLPAGLACGALAMAQLIGSDTWRNRSIWILLGSTPHRVGGLILLLLALAMLGLGGLDLLWPEQFDRLVEGLK